MAIEIAADPGTTPAPPPPLAQPSSRRAVRLPRSPKILIGLGVLVFFILLAVFGPIIAPQDPTATTPDLLAGPSGGHLLGTTQAGQDVFSQLLVGAQSTVLVGFLAGIIATVLSVVIGVSAGYFGGLVDDLLSMLTNVFLVIPGLPLLIVMAAYLPAGTGSNPFVIALIVSVTGWAWGARVLRAQTLSLRNRDYVASARVIGERRMRIIGTEILPNLTAIVASSFVFTVLYAIGTFVALAFLGVVDPQHWSWGSMLFWAQSANAAQVNAWWWFLPPGICIALLGTSLALLNFGIDEFINPRLRAAGLTRKAAKAAGLPRRIRFGLTPVTNKGSGPVTDLVLDIRDLSVDYGIGDDAVHATAGVDLALHRGEVLGLAGESGSGKSTLAYAVTRLLRPPGVITGGEAWFHTADGEVDLLAADADTLRKLRWSEISVVFQSAMHSLNPVYTIGRQLTDVYEVHRRDLSRSARRAKAVDLLRMVGITGDRLSSYPHELSGGMRQRVMIAMALALEPRVVIMDEPTTALDVVTQREIMAELIGLRDRLGFAVLFITHDLSLLIELADSIAVMYAGRLVERAPATALFRAPRHPYTQGLLNSFPSLHGEWRKMTGIAGSPPDLRHLPSGVPVPPALPERHGRVLDRPPAAAGSRSRPRGRVLAARRHAHTAAGTPPAAPLVGSV